ncbi:MAG: zinc-dependent peptidase [Armatimonadetes bacterium]|nr:zinc-dependent peptidase [Armatimonadota bacterium]
MKIEGPQFFGYDRQYIQVVRQETPRSIKPNIFRDLDNNVTMALLLTDAVSLSPEALEILKVLKKKMEQTSLDFALALKDEEILYDFKKLQELLNREKPKENKDPKTQKFQEPAHEIVLPLGKGEREKKEPKSGAYSPLREKISQIIVYFPSSEIKEKLIKELEVLGDKIIDTCKKFGVRIIVLEGNQVLSNLKIAGIQVVAKGEKTFDGRDWDTVRGLYDSDRRLIVLGEEQIGLKNRSTARHEFAHAFDHTFSTQNNRRLPLSVQLWNLFRETRKEVISEYANTNPAEYFAESIEEFFNSQGEKKLKDKDPQMYQYLSALFTS